MMSARTGLEEEARRGFLPPTMRPRKRVNQVVLNQLYRRNTVRNVTIYQTCDGERKICARRCGRKRNHQPEIALTFGRAFGSAA